MITTSSLLGKHGLIMQAPTNKGKRDSGGEDDHPCDWPTALQDLIKFYIKYDDLPYSCRGNPLLDECQRRCIQLFQQDYDVYLINNRDGRLCETYPLQVIIPQAELRQNGQEQEIVNDGKEMETQFRATRFCRARYRFAVPWLIHRGRNLCRSAGLAEKMEMAIKMLSLFDKSMEVHRRGYELFVYCPL